MNIISIQFFALLMIVFVLLYLVNKIVKKDEKSILISNWIILVANAIFVGYVDYRFLIVILVISLITWYSGKNKKYSTFGIILCILSLAFFKYVNFFIESFNSVFKTDISVLKILLPIGISFYVFSAISYIVDIKRSKVESHNFFDVLLYLSFFPKILSGPIQRSSDFFEQISKKRTVGVNTFNPGIQIFVFGLFKKIVLADRLAAFVDQVYTHVNSFGSLTVILAVIAYALEIYYDFSGYSDMAIGVSKILGIEMPKNFNLPYLSHNVTELWKRWHITLSSWLQDYLYIPMGGSKKGTIRSYFNITMTMVIGGLWHGANISYIIWGLLHGIALVVHKIWMKITNSKNKDSNLLSNIISIFITFVFTSICWIFFKTENIHQSFVIIKKMFSFQKGIENLYLWLFVAIIVLIVSSLLAYKKSSKDKNNLKYKNNSFVNGYYPILDLNKFWNLVLFFIFCGLVFGLSYTGGSPFIYGNY